MYKFERRVWGHRVRKTVILSLTSSLLTIMPQGPVAHAAPACAEGTHYSRLSASGAATVIYKFTNTSAECTYTLPTGLSTAAILAVGGGGGGGPDGGAGGGGGELRYNATQSLSGISSVDIWVGSGGSGGVWGGSASGSGTASTVKWSGSTQYQANGGAGAGGWSNTGPPGGAGGSGGSGGNANSSGQAGGYGPYSVCQLGASPTGTTPSNSITGSSVDYGGGGGGGFGSNTYNAGSAYLGRPGGGTSGGRGSNYRIATDDSTTIVGASPGHNGTANTGGGGGGGSACDAGNTNGTNQRTAGGAGAAGVVIISFSRMSQTISFGAISERKVTAGTLTVSPTSSSGLTVALTSATPSVCTVSGFVITPVTSGTCTINANQSGDNNFSAATQVQQSFTITATQVTFNRNDGSGTTTTQSVTTAGSFALTANSLTRSNFRFLRWDTLATGLGTAYTDRQTVSFAGDTTLYAVWTSTISYNGNTATSTRAIETTTAYSPTLNSTLSNGRLLSGTPISSGLVLNLDASDSSTINGSTWTNKVAGVSGAEASATIVGSPTYNSTEGYFALNGTSQYFTLGTTNYYFNGTKNFSLSLCYSTSDVNKISALISRYNGSVVGTYLFQQNAGYLYGMREVSPWSTPAASRIIGGENYCVSETYDGSYLRVYINGVLDATSALMTGTVYDSTITAAIGAAYDSNAASRFLKGKIYNAQIYNRALSASEIATNYQSMAPVQKVSKTNYTLGSWNTAADSTGSSYGTPGYDLSALPTPYFRVSAENYSGGTLSASDGASNLSITKTGTPTLNANSGGGYGANARFATISGGTGDGFRLGNAEIPNYTFCGMARYMDLTSGVTGTQGRIFSNASGTNWLSGWYNYGTKDFYHDGWVLESSGNLNQQWHVVCDVGNEIYWDGVKLGVTYQVYSKLPPLAINWGSYGDNSNYEFTEAIAYDQALSQSQIAQIFRYFKNKFGLTDVVTSAQTANVLVPPTNYASSGDATLYASWTSQITYDGNKQTTGGAPSPQSISSAGGTAASAGTLARAGYRFAGWNTAADGSGTKYLAGAALTNDGNKTLYAQWVLPVALPVSVNNPSGLNPYMRLVASDYDAVNKIWRDSSGNSRNVTRISGSPTLATTTGNGATKSFQTVAGGTSDKIYFDNAPISTNWTVFALSRYSGASNRGRIITGNYSASACQGSTSCNWLIGHYGGWAANGHFNGWVPANTYTTPAGVNVSDWIMSTGFPSNYRYNGISRGNSGGTAELPPLGINTWTGETSDFQVAEVIIFDRTLSSTEIGQVEDYFDETYGLAYAKVGTYTTSSTLIAGFGVGGRTDTFTATNGLGNKIFSVSPVVAGITIDTSTANGVALVVGPLVSSGTYIETITATDQAGYTAQHAVTVTVSPSVKFDTSTATTIITTSGRGTSLKLNTVNGIGTKIFTMTQTSALTSTWITLDTSTASSGYATLKVDTYTAPGSYTISIVVTDSTKLKSTYVVTVTVTAPPTLASTSAITTAPILGDLRVNLDAGNPLSYSGSGSTWTDLSGNARNGTLQSSPTFSNANGGVLNFDGSTQYVTVPSVVSETFTVEAWVKFNAVNNNYASVITNVYGGNKINYSISFWGDSTIRAGYHQAGTGWVGGTTGAFTPLVGTWYQLVYKVEKVGTNYIGSLYQNGNLVAGQTTSTIAPNNDQLVDRIGRRWDSGDYINGSIPIVRIYSRSLSDAEITQNYNATSPRFLNTPTNSVTLSTTQGVATSSSIYYAGLGTGVKTFTTTPSVAGVTLDTSTVNTVRINFANTLQSTDSVTARVITQTINAYDEKGQIATTPLYVSATINPPVVISASTPTTLSTTFGTTAYDTFTATRGMGGPYTFTVTSSSYQSAFTISKPSANVGLLTIANNLPAGTYYETITATDSSTASTDYFLTVIVNPRITIGGATSNSVSTTIGKAASIRINVFYGTGARTLSFTSPSAGITIDSSTITSNYATLNVSTSIASNTYTLAITARDSLGVSSTETFTVNVNKAPKIGTPTIASSGLQLNLDAGNALSYPGTGTTWTDLSGNGRNGTWQSTPVFTTDSGGLLTIGNTTAQYMSRAGLPAMTTFTAETWVKFNSIPSNDACVLSDKYNATYINFAICFNNSSQIVGGYWNSTNSWVRTTATAIPSINTWYHFVYTVSLSGSTYTSILYQNGVAVGAAVTSAVAPNSGSTGFLVGTNWRADTTVVPGQIAAVRIYNRALTAAEALQNYTAIGYRYVNAASGNDSVTVTAGRAGSISAVTATDGTGDKTFTLSGLNSGVSISSPAANQFALALSENLTSVDSVTARTLYETVTATDASTATTTFTYTIRINPPVQETFTAASVTTTSGILAYDTFTATYGTGAYTFTLTGSPTTSGFTLTQSGNVAVLKVESTVNPGTYYETVTATDSLGATKSQMVTFVVLPGPTVSGISVLSATTGSAFRSPGYTTINGFGTKTMTLTSNPVNANIKFDTATAGYAFITVASTGVSAGTYYETITVTDSKGAKGYFPITLTVADPVTLSGNQTVNTVFGTSTSVGYSTSTNGIYNIVASDVCTSTKSTFIGNGTNGLNGVSYTVEEFLGASSSACGWVVPAGVDSVTALVVAGGGQGGEGRGGGGGAGGVLYGQLAVTAGATLNLQVGLGGSISTCSDAYRPAGCDGVDSSIGTTAIAKGGGGGGGHVAVTAGRSGGSGGGGGMNYANESPTAGSTLAQTYPVGWISAGFAGGTTRNGHPSDLYRNTGGGGGAVTTGFIGNCWTAGGINGRGCLNTGGGEPLLSSNAGDRPDGGEGISASTTGALAAAAIITGTAKNYAGGGGGAVGIATQEVNGTYYSGPPGVGKSGGGNGANVTTIFGANATPNTGSGGGGGVNADGVNRTGGNGASGVIVLRYVTPTVAAYNNAITFVTDNTGTASTRGQITMTVPDSLTVGSYTKTISVASYDGSNKLGSASSYAITINIAKATPTVALSLPGAVTTAKYGNPVTISAAASTAGNVLFKYGNTGITACSAVATSSGIATCSWTPSAIGAVTLKATLTPTDTTNYNNSNETSFSVTVGKADTLTVTASNESLTYTGSTALVTKPFTTSGLVSIDSLTAVSMIYSGTANDGTNYSSSTAPTLAGTYVATPDTSTAGISTISGNYIGVTTVAGTFTLNRARNTSSLVYPTVNTNSAVTSPPANNYITFKTGVTDTATTKSRLGNGAISYSSLTSSTCSVDSSTALMSVIQAGSCIVKMTVAEGNNYLADSATATIEIAKGNRTIALTSATATLKYSDTATVTTTISDGALDGNITYSLNASPGCTFDSLGGILTATSGTLACTLNATLAEGTNFLTTSTSSALALTIAKANAPVITIDTVTAVSYVPGQRAQVSPIYRVTGFKGTDAASSLTLTYGFVSNPFESFSYSDTRTPIDAGTYSITPSAIVMSSGLATNYETPNYAGSAITFTINRIAQDPITIDGINGEVSVPFTLVYRGGNNPTATATFTKVSGAACTVTGNGLNATAAGTCGVTVTVPANRNYLAITSDTITVRVRSYVIVPIFIFGNGTTGITIATTTTLTKGDERCSSGCTPTITAISPYEGSEGDVIVLTGTNFTGAIRVIFNVFTAASTFNVDSDTQITAQIPAGLTIGDGTIEVVTPGGTSPRWFDFGVLP